jgi:hypothetical protein
VTWAQQRQLVRSLSDRAQDKRREARRVRSNLKGWTTNYLGSAETLVWLFAAGSFWAAGRSSTTESSAARRSMMAVINTSLLAWQLVHRQFELAQPTVNHPPEEQR